MKRLSLVALLLSVVLGCMANPAGKFTTRTYKLRDFTNIQVDNVVKVIYTQGNAYEVKLTGRTDWLDLMEVSSADGTLKVVAKKTKKFNNVKKQDQPDGHHNFILRLTVPCLKNIRLSGVSAFEGKHLTSDHLSLNMDGVSKFKVDAIKCTSLNLDLSGVSKIEVGDVKCQKIEASIQGASKVDLPRLLQAERATFDVTGASKLDLTADMPGLLKLDVSGASKGTLTYKGGNLKTSCTSSSHLNADVNCKDINVQCSGASRATFSGTAGKVDVSCDGVASKVNTSDLRHK